MTSESASKKFKKGLTNVLQAFLKLVSLKSDIEKRRRKIIMDAVEEAEEKKRQKLKSKIIKL
jgi:triphosphoribosyl-dephospho-CoA synthetase